MSFREKKFEVMLALKTTSAKLTKLFLKFRIHTFRTSPKSPNWFEPGRPLYIRATKRTKAVVNAGKPTTNAVNIALVNGKTDLVGHGVRRTTKALLWDKFMGPFCRSAMNPNAYFLTRDMLRSSKMDLFIRTINALLVKEGEQLCVTRNSAYRHG